MSGPFRDDIQILRAFAIIAVLLFHLWPDQFPRGYLGVDIFFAISGYLIAVQLINSNVNTYYAAAFLFRRIKRIFPVCYFLIMLSLIIGYYQLHPSVYKDLRFESISATLFITNLREAFKKTTYFDTIKTEKFLLHTWSLGVEFQFYISAPLIFALITRYPRHATIIFLITSFVSHAYFSESMSFYFPYSRFWQFLMGASGCLVHLVQNFGPLEDAPILDNEVNPHTPSATRYLSRQIIAVLVLMITVLIPISFESYFSALAFKIFVTMITSLLLAWPQPQWHQFPQCLFASLVKLGDASYVVYLFHWPIIVFNKEFEVIVFQGNSFLLLVIIIMVSLLIHHFFEKPLRRSSDITNAWFILVFALIIIYISMYSNNVAQYNRTLEAKAERMSQEEKNKILQAIRGNDNLMINPKIEFPCDKDPFIEKYAVQLWANHTGFRCSHTLLTEDGNKKEAVIIGNSYAGAIYPGVTKALKLMNYSKVYLFARSGCLPFGGELNREYLAYQCDHWIGKVFDQFLSIVKPEVIFLSGRLDMFEGLMKPLPSSTNLLAIDFAAQQIHEYFLNFAKFTKMLVIISPNPDIEFSSLRLPSDRLKAIQQELNFVYDSPLSLSKSLRQTNSVEQYVLPISYVSEILTNPEKRILAAMDACKNCVYFNTTSLFCNHVNCPLYDEDSMLAVLKDRAHLSTVGADKLVHQLREVLQGNERQP